MQEKRISKAGFPFHFHLGLVWSVSDLSQINYVVTVVSYFPVKPCKTQNITDTAYKKKTDQAIPQK